MDNGSSFQCEILLSFALYVRLFLSYLCKQGIFVSTQTKLIETLFLGGITPHCLVTNVLATNTFVCFCQFMFCKCDRECSGRGKRDVCMCRQWNR